MSFIVKGIELPVNCFRCPLNWDERQRYTLCVYLKKAVPYKDVPYDRRLSCCKLAEVLTPHGRLIDADVLIEQIREEGINQAKDYANRNHPVVRAYGDCYGKVVDAPTIIEAEE